MVSDWSMFYATLIQDLAKRKFAKLRFPETYFINAYSNIHILSYEILSIGIQIKYRK